MITLKGIEKSFNKTQVFSNLDFTMNQTGIIYTIVGPSGSGKTTLLNLLFGLDFQYSGEYDLFGKSTKSLSNDEWAMIRRNELQIVFQDYKLIEKLTVKENLQLTDDYSLEMIDSILTKVQMSGFANHLVKDLSGGQKQRIAIARALMNQPKILLLDEPTGNLDDETTDGLMNYLKQLAREGLTLLIITHDKAVIEASDVVYQLTEGQLLPNKTVDELSNQSINNTLSKQKKINPKTIMTYLGRIIATTKLQLFLIGIPIIVIFMLFILGYATYQNHVIGTYQRMFSGIEDNIIMMDTQELHDSALKENLEQNIRSSFDGIRIGFSEEDVELISDIAHVQDYALTEGDITSVGDKNGYTLNLMISAAQFPPSLKSKQGFFNDNAVINFTFESLSVPNHFIQSFNLNHIQLIEGEFPKDESNEILIPDILAEFQMKSIDFSALIDQTIELPVIKSITEEADNKEYVISGIYKTNYLNTINSSYLIYLGYFEDPDQQWWFSEESYLGMKTSFQSNAETTEYMENILATFETFLKARGTGYPRILIEVDNPKNVESVYKELQKKFPKYRLVSQYDFKNGDLSKIYEYERNKMVVGSVVISIILGVLITFLNKSYYKKRSKELAILYSLGYRKRDILRLILSENILLMMSYLLIAYLINLIIYFAYFKYSAFFNFLSVITDPMIALQIVVLVFVIIFVSVLWCVRGVNQRQLRKHLNEDA